MNGPRMQPSTKALERELHYQSRFGWVFTVAAVIILLILPRYFSPPFDAVWMGFGAAAMLTIFVLLYPESLRNQLGSLFTARCLVAALWLIAAFTAVLLAGPSLVRIVK